MTDTIAQRVKLTVTGDCGHILWQGYDKIEDKYPFWCEECADDKRTGKYPWTLAAEIVPAEGPGAAPAAVPCSLCQLRAERGIDQPPGGCTCQAAEESK
jgi:hypothetical protein